MSNKTIPDLKELFKQAAEIAEQVPENMQEAAFNRALEMLTGDTGVNSTSKGSGLSEVTKRKAKKKESATSKQEGSSERLIKAIDSTQHPGIISATKALDRALMVLQIALTEHQIDGLSPTDIATILTDKFRISTTSAAVGMALGRVTTLVNRIPQKNGFIYRIMGPGQVYLTHLKKEGKAVPASTRKPANKKKATAKTKAVKETSVKKTVEKKKIGKKNARRRKKGATAILDELIQEGFFKSPQTISKIIRHCSTHKAQKFKTNELSTPLTRFVRNAKLKRNENSDAQFEYKKA